MRKPALIALDLDGTLLNDKKQLTDRARAALEAAAAAGAEIVPATGRFYRGIPEVIRDLPFVRYAITVNGAQVIDARDGKTIYAAEIPGPDAVAQSEPDARLDDPHRRHPVSVEGKGGVRRVEDPAGAS